MAVWTREWIAERLTGSPPYCEKCKIPMVLTRQRPGNETDRVEMEFECLTFTCGRTHLARIDLIRGIVSWDNEERAT